MYNILFRLSLIMFLGSYVVAEESPSRISDEVKPLQLSNFPERPAPILELGDSFMDTGKLSNGFLLPTGAVWNPSFVLWGDIRNAVQTIDPDVDVEHDRLSEVASRVDLYGNLYLSQTERVLIGFRPVDQRGQFTRYTFESPEGGEKEDFYDELNAKPTVLFFEGDFGELFPFLDPRDEYGMDLGFSVGRQVITWQDGMLISDRIDSLGISKINIKNPYIVNHRATVLWGWNELNRNSLSDDDKGSSLYGLSNEVDLKETTFELDFVYVDAKKDIGSGYFGGLGFTQRISEFNHTIRVLGSLAADNPTANVDDGILIFNELSTDLYGGEDYVYLDSFYGIDNFRSATRAPEFGGPLGGTGILFAAVGLGRYGAALGNQADDSFGSAIGYQSFFNHRRQQLVLEFGGRYATEDIGQRALATGLSLQTAVGRRHVLRFDTFGRYGASRSDLTSGRDSILGFGARMEWMVRL